MSHGTHEQEERFELLGPLDESVGPARRISRQRSAELIQGALSALAASPAPTPRRKHPWKGILVTGTCLALVGSAAASYWRWGPRAPETAAPQVAAPVEVAPPPAPAPSAPVPPSEAAPAEEAVAVAPAPPVTRAEPAPVVAAEPEDLLRRANERRAAGQWREAEALYLRVIQGSPGTTSAYVAQVASGGLRLEHLEDARGALRQYQQALRARPRGMLSEEARQGVAESWRALGDTGHEAQALEELLAAHPDSLLAESARRRLNELSRAPR